MVEWEEVDRFSFEDSDRFEEDSLCSWSSEPESLCNNWRGWKRPPASFCGGGKKNSEGEVVSAVPSLAELSAKCVASHIPFELVEHVYPPVPEQLQLRIAFWSFPDNEEDIRLYSCLANGASDEFTRGEHLVRNSMVKDPLQIGFHLSATVQQNYRATPTVSVAVTFDRRRISSCSCTCDSSAYWCSHVVAVCLTRIHSPHLVTLRAPVSESLSRLHREQLQKFAQYLISELPQQILPTAQRLLDELLGSQPSAINSVCGAPDPTAGASANDQTSWYLDEKALHENIKKILIKFCVPAPIVFSDVNYLSTVAPPAAAEWTSLLRPLRGREPEGMWNLLSIVREMFKRNDRNAIPLLEIITEECIACEQILMWWFNTKVAMLNGNSGYGGGGGGKHNNVNSNTHASQHACSSLCDEVVILWRLAALNPGLAPHERDMLHSQFTTWHLKILDKCSKCRNNSMIQSNAKMINNLKLDLEVFTGFKPAIEACYLDWDDYPMPGITYNQETNPMYHCPFTSFRHGADNRSDTVTQVNSSQAVLNCEHPHTMAHSHHHHHHYHHHHRSRVTRFDFSSAMSFNPAEYPLGHPTLNARGDGNRSSVSSEGFCENDDDINVLRGVRTNERYVDSDSQEGGGSDSSSNDSSNSNGDTTPASVQNDTGNSDSDNIVQTCIDEPEEPVPKAPKKPAKRWMAADQDVAGTSAVLIVSSNSANSRRPSKDDSTSSSNSESPQSAGEDYNLYFFNSNANKEHKENAEDTDMKPVIINVEIENQQALFAGVRKCDDPWDVLFSRAEGLHAHGHNKEACMLSVQLAEELLANPPDLMIEIPTVPRRKGKKQQVNPASHQLSCLASGTLAKCAFLCSVLENPEHSHLAFRVGMFGLEMPRPPASTKPLEVKMANQETDLVNLLKRIPLTHLELQIIRERAEHLRDGTIKSRGEAMLPTMLASFIFDALVVPNVGGRDRNKMSRLPSDEPLAFEAAVAALGMKINVSEADHPLLCEGTRRQRGDLAISLLTFYKDDCWKLARIMDRLLDREVHQLLKTPLHSSYYSNNPPVKSSYSLLGYVRRDECDKVMTPMSSYMTPSEMLPPDMGCCSRPHSSTSAEFEQGLANLNMANTSTAVPVQPANVQQVTRTKESRYKGKRAYPSIPNQPSEAGAHFMFELAKIVLNKAGGSSSTSLFTQPSTSQQHHLPHRALHMCAFQMGLYALGLHNCVSPNWLSRTYSSHVSWITGQAMEIGAAAIAFLIDTWEGHLTPPEAASIADRASRGCDPNLVRSAAELALSALPHAAALNPNEIQRAIMQCKEQSDEMLEHACLTVETAAKGGGVYPEVLFQVAKYWYELYIQLLPGGEQMMETEMQHEALIDPHGALVALVEQPPMEAMQLPPGMPPPNGASAVIATSGQVVVTTAPPPPYQHPAATTLAPLGITIPYAAVAGHFNFLSHHPAHPHAHHAHAHHQISYGGPIHPQAVTTMQPMHHQPPPPPPPTAHVQMYQFQYPPQPAIGGGQQFAPAQPQAYANMPPPQQVPSSVPPAQYPMPPTPAQATYTANPQAQYTTLTATPPNQMQQIRYYGTGCAMPQPAANMRPAPLPTAHIYPMALPPPGAPPPGMVAQQVRAQPHRPPQFNQNQLRYLLTAYRVGMLAMETLARRVHDDRPQAKYARNPPYGEDVKWLLRISKHLGSQYLHHFCVCAVNSIVSPFVLHDVAIEAAHYLSRNNPTMVMQHLRSALTPIVQKCQQMYIQCMHQKLYHLTQADYEDFVSIVCAARAAFQITPDGSAQFREWLQSIKRSKSCKKDLWAQINAAVQANTK